MKKFFRGGTIINSLSEVPLKIKELSAGGGNLAKGTLNQKVNLKSGGISKVNIPIRLNFTPTYSVFKLVFNSTEIAYLGTNTTGYTAIGSLGYLKIDECEITPMNVNLTLSNSGSGTRTVFIKEWIAVG